MNIAKSYSENFKNESYRENALLRELHQHQDINLRNDDEGLFQMKDFKTLFLKRAQGFFFPYNLPFSTFIEFYISKWASLVAQTVKNPSAMRGTWLRSLGWDDLLEEGMETHSNILAWRIPMDREAWRLQFMGLQRVGHN